MSTKTVWITGASSGIGREFARRYARLGFRLILTARRRDRLETLAAELRAKHGTLCRIVPADLEQDAQVAALCEALADERIDLFINNAGFGACGAFSETDEGKELSMLRVNVLAMHRLFKFTLRKMEAQGFGTILNVASSAGLLPGGPYMAGYYASKAYVVSLTRGVAEELREQHSPVYVCALCGHRVQRPCRRGVRPQGHHPGALRGGSHARDAPPQDHHCAQHPDAPCHHGPEARSHAPAHAHRGPPAEEKAGLMAA